MNTKSTNLDGYGTPPIAWEKVQEVLTSEITPATVFAFGTAEPYGATRFDVTR